MHATENQTQLCKLAKYDQLYKLLHTHTINLFRPLLRHIGVRKCVLKLPRGPSFRSSPAEQPCTDTVRAFKPTTVLQLRAACVTALWSMKCRSGKEFLEAIMYPRDTNNTYRCALLWNQLYERYFTDVVARARRIGSATLTIGCASGSKISKPQLK
jgi:hypothetical protein